MELAPFSISELFWDTELRVLTCVWMTSPMVFDVRKGHFPLGHKKFGPGKIFQETKSPISIHARFFIRNLAQGLVLTVS